MEPGPQQVFNKLCSVFQHTYFLTKMPIGRRDKIFIAIGCLVGLAILWIVVDIATNFTASVKQYCPGEVKKCNESNQLYHLESKQCLQKGQSNGRICGNNMVISPLITCRTQGICECDYDSNERHLVYDDGTDQCYPIYSQGPCEDGYVVTISSHGRKLKCRRDVCADEKSKASSTERDSIVPYKNSCYALLSKLEEPGCRGQLKFWNNQVYPSCSPPEIYQTGGFSQYVAARCPPGSVQALNGYCKLFVNFAIKGPTESEEDDY